MADYFTPTVVQQTIPTRITPLEIILLSYVFSGEVHAGGWYFFAEQAPSDFLFIPRREIEDGLNASRHVTGEANTKIEELLAEQPELEVDMSVGSYEFILQDIVRRSTTLEYINVVSAFTCSKMRPDGFGGMAVLITPETVKGKSTLDFIQDFLVEEGLS
jgi:hypothetical protein